MSARAVVLIIETENQIEREKKPHLSCGKAGKMSKDCHAAEYKLHINGTIFVATCRNKQDLIRVDCHLVFCGTNWHCHLHHILQE